MTLLNRLLSDGFDLLLAPFRDLPPILTLAVLAIVTSIGMLIVFKAASNQEKLASHSSTGRASRNAMQANSTRSIRRWHRSQASCRRW